MMDDGVSWSGHERNNAYLNRGEGRHVEVSSVLGLDFLDDGRCAAAWDWDGDGDQDLVLRNRTGPQLRILENTLSPTPQCLVLELIGQTCNRNAIGARVTVLSRSGRRTQWVRGEDGYLASPSRRLVFPFSGGDDAPASIEVRWPGGESESITPPKAAGTYRVAQGAGKATPHPVVSGWGEDSSIPVPPADGPTVVVLRTPLPLPPNWRKRFSTSPKWTALNTWSFRCVPCVLELRTWAGRAAEFGPEVMPTCVGVDDLADQALADDAFRSAGPEGDRSPPFPLIPADPAQTRLVGVLTRHVTGIPGSDLTLPATWIVSPDGAIQAMIFGVVEPPLVAALVRDLKAQPPHRRSLFEGRWLLRTPRDGAGLASACDAAELPNEAVFYRSMR